MGFWGFGDGGSANVTASAADLEVWQVDVVAGSAAGSYLFVNDSVDGAAIADFLIRRQSSNFLPTKHTGDDYWPS